LVKLVSPRPVCNQPMAWREMLETDVSRQQEKRRGTTDIALGGGVRCPRVECPERRRSRAGFVHGFVHETRQDGLRRGRRSTLEKTSGRKSAEASAMTGDSRDGGEGRRSAHNPEVAGSNPAPATKSAGQRPLPIPGESFLLCVVHMKPNTRLFFRPTGWLWLKRDVLIESARGSGDVPVDVVGCLAQRYASASRSLPTRAGLAGTCGAQR